MTALAQDFTIWQGEDKSIGITVYETEEGRISDLTGANIEWICKKRITDTTPILTKSISSGIEIPNGADGKFKIYLYNTETDDLLGKYYHEAKVTLNNQKEVALIGEMTVVRSGFISNI